MSAKKRITIVSGIIALTLLVMLGSLIIVLVSGSQSASSYVSIGFTGVGVETEISLTQEEHVVTYTESGAVVNSYNSTTINDTAGNTKIVLDDGSASGVFNYPTSTFAPNTTVALLFRFVNTSPVADIKLSLTETPTTRTNINLSYKTFGSYCPSGSELFADTVGTRLSSLEDQYLASSNNGNGLLYIAVYVELLDKYQDASLEGNLNWSLTVTEAVSVTINGVSNSYYKGYKYHEPDFTDYTRDNYRLDCFKYESGGNRVQFPVTLNDDIVITPYYSMGTVPTENLILSSDETYYRVGGVLTDTTHPSKILVIPDTYNGLPVTLVDGCTESGTPGGPDHLVTGLAFGTTITHIYIGNYVENVVELATKATGTASGFDDYVGLATLQYIEFGRNTEIVRGESFAGCTGITNFGFYSNIKDITTIAQIDANWYMESAIHTLSADMQDIELVSCLDDNDKLVCLNDPRNGITNCSNWDKVICIAGGAFEGVGSGVDLIIPSAMTEISSYAFFMSQFGIYSIPSHIKKVRDGAFYAVTTINTMIFEEGLEEIGNNAFFSCSNLRGNGPNGELVIPNSVTRIAPDAFAENQNLTGIKIGSGLTELSGFSCCYGITSVTFANESNITRVADNAFNYCRDLINIVLPESVEYIGENAFLNCSSLKSINLPSNLKVIGKSAFQDCLQLKSITIPPSVTNIGNYAFYGCTALEELNYNATNATDFAFENYTFYQAGTNGNGLTLNIGANVTYIPACFMVPMCINDIENMEANRTSHYEVAPNLVSINVEDGSQLKIIGQYSFVFCENLIEVDLPEGLEWIYSYAFARCTGIKKIVIPSTVLGFGGVFRYCSGLTDLTIREGVKKISDGAFVACTNLVNVTLPSTLTVLGKYSFNYCSSLKYLSIPDNVTQIGTAAFQSCYKLERIRIPESVTSIGSNAIQNCLALEKIEYNAVNLADFAESNTILNNRIGENSTYGIVVVIGNKVERIPANLFNTSAIATNYLPNIRTVIFEEGAVCHAIGNNAFKGITSLTSIVIPAKCSLIGINAFAGCTNLMDAHFERTSGWYYASTSDATSGTSLTLTNRLMNGVNLNSTYSGYYWIKEPQQEVTFNLGGIDKSSVSNLQDLEYIEFSSTLVIAEEPTVMADNYYIEGWYLDEEYVTEAVFPLTFTEDTTLYAKVLDGNVVLVDNGTYASVGDNDSLAVTQAVIPDYYDFGNGLVSVTEITDNAFYGNNNIVEVKISSNMLTIGDLAFGECINLTNILIPRSVTTIGEFAIDMCESLESVAVESGNTAYDSRNNCNAIIETSINKLIVGCKNTIIPDTVTCIASSAFYTCTDLTNITIPNSVQTIEEWAFYGCSDLVSINIPNTVTRIETETFADCVSLTSITIPSSVNFIAEGVFTGCKSLASIVVDSNNTVYDSRNNCNAIVETATNTLIYGCKSTVIPDTITSIEEYAFCGHSELTGITIPASVTYIRKYAFSGCTGLLEANGGSGIVFHDVTIWQKASDKNFTSNVAMVDVTNANTIASQLVKESGYYNYYWRNNDSRVVTFNLGDISSSVVTNIDELQPISFGESLTIEEEPKIKAHNYYFGGWYLDADLTNKVSFPLTITEQTELYAECIEGNVLLSNNTTYASVADNAGTATGDVVIPDYYNFGNGLIPVTTIITNAFAENSMITSVKIPGTITSFGVAAFYNCQFLRSVTMAYGATHVGGFAFQNCVNLTSVSLPNTLQWIDGEAFSCCTGLTSIVIPEGVTNIGMEAFDGCTGLTSIIIPETVTYIDFRAFRGCTGLLSENGGSGIIFEDTTTWKTSPNNSDPWTEVVVTNPSQNAIWLVSTSEYYERAWKKV